MARHDVLPVTPWATRPERSQTLYYLARTLLRTRSGGCTQQVEPLLFSVEAVQSSSAAQLVTFSRNGPVLERVIIPVRASHVPNPTHPLVIRVRQATRGRWGRICSVRQHCSGAALPHRLAIRMIADGGTNRKLRRFA